jgi:hypothetical protein
LKQEAGRGGVRVGSHVAGPGAHLRKQRGLDRLGQAGLGAQGERRADLYACGPTRTGPRQSLGRSVAAGEPERQAQPGNGGRVDGVAGTVERLASVVQAELAPRRSIVSAGRRPFDDEPIGTGGGLASQRVGEGGGRHDRQEAGSAQGRQRCAVVVSPELPWVEGHVREIARMIAYDGDAQRDRLMGGQRVEQRRDVAGDAGAHRDVVHPGEQRPVQPCGRGQAHLVQVVDRDRPVVALFGEEHLHEVGRDRQLGERVPLLDGRPGHGLERPVAGDPGTK